jgi:uncharacterized membrane protein YciS (DUF1049 family)
MERAGSFIRFIVIPLAIFFTAGLLVGALAIGFVFMTVGIIRHLKHLWANRTS